MTLSDPENWIPCVVSGFGFSLSLNLGTLSQTTGAAMPYMGKCKEEGKTGQLPLPVGGGRKILLDSGVASLHHVHFHGSGPLVRRDVEGFLYLRQRVTMGHYLARIQTT